MTSGMEYERDAALARAGRLEQELREAIARAEAAEFRETKLQESLKISREIVNVWSPMMDRYDEIEKAAKQLLNERKRVSGMLVGEASTSLVDYYKWLADAIALPVDGSGNEEEDDEG